MSGLQDISGPMIDWLAKTSWQACVVIAAVLLAQAVFRRWLPARWRYTLWGLLVLRLLMPALPACSTSIFNLMPDVPRPERRPTPEVWVSVPDSTPASPLAVAQPSDSVGSAASLNWRPMLVAPWLAGALGMVLLIGRRRLRLARCLACGRAVSDPRLLRLVADCRREMRIRRPVVIVEMDGLPGPAVAGVFRSKLLLPLGFADALGEADQRLIFLHELAHVRCRDAGVDCLLDLLLIVNWFNPAVWFAMARLRADRELARDEMVLSTGTPRDARSYGMAILGLVERFNHPDLAQGSLALIHGKRQLTRRIHMIAAFRPTGIARAALAIALLLTVGCATLTGQKAPAPVLEPAPLVTRQYDVSSILNPPEGKKAPMQPAQLAAMAEKLIDEQQRDRGGQVKLEGAQLSVIAVEPTQSMISAWIAALKDHAGPMVMIEMRLLSITEKHIASLDAPTRAKWGLDAPDSTKAAVAAISQSDLAELLASARNRKETLEILIGPRVLVNDGQDATIQIGSVIPYISDYTPVRSSDGQTRYEPKMGKLEDGMRIDMRPTVANDRNSAKIQVHPKLTHLRTMAESSFPGVPAGQKLKVQKPEVDVREIQTTVNLPNAGTVAITGMGTMDAQKDKPPARLVFVMTASILNPVPQ
ncbi:MAG: hypothetical protein NTU53_13435 [Planctomycetota bacterium]|nr:hypothetical protein [Planctomycetota bacterium]